MMIATSVIMYTTSYMARDCKYFGTNNLDVRAATDELLYIFHSLFPQTTQCNTAVLFKRKLFMNTMKNMEVHLITIKRNLENIIQQTNVLNPNENSMTIEASIVANIQKQLTIV